MANSLGTNPIVLDTFTLDINLGMKVKISSIEWQTPTTIDHTAVITNDVGTDVFNETCSTAKQSIIKYYHGIWIDNLKIVSNGVSSGKIIITLC